jgi:hypothetical protein
MQWTQLSRVAYMFPAEPPGAVEFFRHLAALLGRTANCTVYDDLITIIPLQPMGALPVTSFELADIDIPKIVLETDLPFDLRIGNLYIHGSEVAVEIPYIPQPEAAAMNPLLPMDELTHRFIETTAQLERTGLTIHPQSATDAVWLKLLNHLSSISSLYRCPGQEDVYCVLPTTNKEVLDGITQVFAGRAPKFELVSSAAHNLPVIQFHIDVGFGRRQIESLLPETRGIQQTGQDPALHSVFVDHPWRDILMRFDIGSGPGVEPDNWATGEKLIRGGERLSPQSF